VPLVRCLHQTWITKALPTIPLRCWATVRVVQGVKRVEAHDLSRIFLWWPVRRILSTFIVGGPIAAPLTR